LSRKTLLFAYFLAAASIFEPERSNERLAWMKTTALVEAITSYFDEDGMRAAFLHEFRNNADPQDCINRRYDVCIYDSTRSIEREFFDSIKLSNDTRTTRIKAFFYVNVIFKIIVKFKIIIIKNFKNLLLLSALLAFKTVCLLFSLFIIL
jgi:hypothetical protein